MINGTHTKKCSGLTFDQFHEKYQTERYLLELKIQLLKKYYVSTRNRFLQYYYHSPQKRLKPRTVNVGDGPDDRKYILTDGEIKKHLKGEILLGVYFQPKITRILCFDLDTKEKSLLSYLVHVLYDLGFGEHNIVITFSGNKGYHVDVLFNEPIFRNVAQGIYDYVKKRTGIKQLECRGGTDDRGYKLPMGITFINGENVYCYPCTERGDQIPEELELEYIKPKEGISGPALAKICKEAGIPYIKKNKKGIDERRELQRGSKCRERIRQQEKGKNQRSEIQKQKVQTNDKQKSNLTFNFRENSKARCQDYIKLIQIRNRDCEGFRNELLFEYAVSYKVQLSTQEGILREIKKVNEKFKNPLKSESELKSIAKSAMALKNQFKTDTIIAKLGITKGEQEQLEVIRTEDIKRERKNRKRREKREAEREETRKREYIEIKNRVKRGETITQIAGALGIHRATVYRKIRSGQDQRKKVPIGPKNATQVVAPRFSLVESPLLDAPQCSSDQVSADLQANSRKVIASNHNSGPPGSKIVIA